MKGMQFYVVYFGLLALLLGIVTFNVAVWGLHRYPKDLQLQVPVARAERGPELIRSYGCGGCHTVPGVPGATGKVGPQLDRLTQQTYIAGVLPSSGQNLAWWIHNPQEVNPRTAMPDLGVTETDARDLAAFLYSTD